MDRRKPIDNGCNLMEAGKRVAGNPQQIPTAKGYFGFRRGVIVGVDGNELLVEFDLIPGERKKKIKRMYFSFLVSEEKLDKWIEENRIFDPYAGGSSPHVGRLNATN